MNNRLHRALVSSIAPSTLKVGVNNVCLCLNLDQCNLRCIMCWQTYDREANRQRHQVTNMSRVNLLGLLRSEALMDATISVVGGGEPFLYPYMEDLLREATVGGRRLMIMTNGTLLHHYPFLWEIAEKTNITLMFSVDAATAETYSVVRPPGYWSELTANIERFVALRENNPGLQFSTSFVVLKQNLPELVDFMRLNVRWKSSYIHIHPAIQGAFPAEWCINRRDPEYLEIIRECFALAQEHSIFMDQPEELVPEELVSSITQGPIVTSPMSLAQRLSSRWRLHAEDPRWSCSKHTTDMTVTVTGDIYLCDTAFRACYPCGNVFEAGFMETWLSKPWLSVRLAHHLGTQERHYLCSQCLLIHDQINIVQD
jgi:radical SAM protein with 4Fe4S-binding SPASM domain